MRARAATSDGDPLPGHTGVQVIPVSAVPSIRPGDDLVTILTTALTGEDGPLLRTGDVLCVATKIVSKARGLTAPSTEKAAAVASATRRVVARRRHGSITTAVVHAEAGPIMAAAGVDASNSPDGVLLLPTDPDAEARALRRGIEQRLGVRVAVVLTDTLSRVWRVGVSDIALGASGLAALQDLRGTLDGSGRPLVMTRRALADECAAAADLVKGKTSGIPAAIVRGLPGVPADPDTETGAAALNRTGSDDWFQRPSLESVWQALGLDLEQEPVAAMELEPEQVRIDRALDVAGTRTTDRPHDEHDAGARIERRGPRAVRVVAPTDDAPGWAAAGALAERVRTALRAETIAGPLPAVAITLGTAAETGTDTEETS